MIGATVAGAPAAEGWLVCPACRGPLADEPGSLACAACARRFPVHLGIPDLRGAPDGPGTWPEEAALLPRLVEAYAHSDVRVLLEVLLAGLRDRSDADRAHLRDYFVTGLAARARHRAAVVDLLCAQAGRRPDRSRPLEIGCGAGAMLFELARHGPAIGIDPNLLHLVIAQKHAETLGLPVRLVCGYAERLPLPPASCTFVHFMHTLEHFTDQRRGLAAVADALAPGGVACFDVPNRFSLWREPHTGRWGLGFLPRRWTALARIRNLSRRELGALVLAAFGDDRFMIRSMLVRFDVPGYAAGGGVRAAARVLRAAGRTPALGALVERLQPGFEVVAWKPGVGR